MYMKKVDDAKKDPGYGQGWFKIFEDGYKNGQWCNERVNQQGGWLYATIPQDIEGGQYLIRGEHIALHNTYTEGGTNGNDGSQFFMGYVSGFLPTIVSLLMAVDVVNLMLYLQAMANHKQCPFQAISTLTTHISKSTIYMRIKRNLTAT